MEGEATYFRPLPFPLDCKNMKRADRILFVIMDRIYGHDSWRSLLLVQAKL